MRSSVGDGGGQRHLTLAPHGRGQLRRARGLGRRLATHVGDVRPMQQVGGGAGASLGYLVVRVRPRPEAAVRPDHRCDGVHLGDDLGHRARPLTEVGAEGLHVGPQRRAGAGPRREGGLRRAEPRRHRGQRVVAATILQGHRRGTSRAAGDAAGGVEGGAELRGPGDGTVPRRVVGREDRPAPRGERVRPGRGRPDVVGADRRCAGGARHPARWSAVDLERQVPAREGVPREEVRVPSADVGHRRDRVGGLGPQPGGAIRRPRHRRVRHPRGRGTEPAVVQEQAHVQTQRRPRRHGVDDGAEHVDVDDRPAAEVGPRHEERLDHPGPSGDRRAAAQRATVAARVAGRGEDDVGDAGAEHLVEQAADVDRRRSAGRRRDQLGDEEGAVETGASPRGPDAGAAALLRGREGPQGTVREVSSARAAAEKRCGETTMCGPRSSSSPSPLTNIRPSCVFG